MREEGEYLLWICDRRATPLQRQRSATLRAKLCRPPELSAHIPYLCDGFL